MNCRLLAFAALTALPAAHASTTDAELKAVLERRLSGDLSGACVAAAVIDGGVARAYVCADASAKPRIDERSAFEIGSITKTMNAALLAQRILAGKASLDTPFADVLPQGAKLPAYDGKPILLRHVVTHTSGLPGLPPGFAPKNPLDPYAGLDEAALVAALANVKLERAPGTQFEYSNYATMLLSAALARQAGTDYESLIRKSLFEPLGMANAYVDKRPDSVRVAKGHMSNGRETPAWTLSANLAGVGLVHATLGDMVNYVQAQLGQRESRIADALALTQREVPTQAAQKLGMNWVRVPIGGRTVLMHDGGTGGFATFAGFDPERKRGVVVLADTAIGDVSEIGMHLFDASLPLGKPRTAVKADPAVIDALVGKYVLDGGLKLTLSRRGDALVIQAEGQPAFMLTHDSAGDFFPTEFDALLRPRRLDDGSYMFVWHQLGGVQAARRLDGRSAAAAPALSAEALAAYAGEYPLAPGFALTVFEKGGKLFVQGTGQQPIEVASIGNDVFAAAVVDAELRFERRDGKVVAITLVQNGQNLRGERK